MAEVKRLVESGGAPSSIEGRQPLTESGGRGGQSGQEGGKTTSRPGRRATASAPTMGGSRSTVIHSLRAPGLDPGTARVFGHRTHQQPLHEVAAWRLAASLGGPWLRLVPPCVMRRCVGRLGSLARGVEGIPGSRMADDLPAASAAGFFDALIGQQDRHRGNFLRNDDRVWLIDHGFAFARDGDPLNESHFVDLRNRWAPQLTAAKVSALDRLLCRDDLLGVAGVLEADRADALRKRARRMRSTGRVLRSGEF